MPSPFPHEEEQLNTELCANATAKQKSSQEGEAARLAWQQPCPLTHLVVEAQVSQDGGTLMVPQHSAEQVGTLS